MTIGAANKIGVVDNKKYAAAEKAAFIFRTSKISLADVPDDDLKEIYKFPTQSSSWLMTRLLQRRGG